MAKYSILLLIIPIFFLSCKSPATENSMVYQLPAKIAAIPVGNQYGFRAPDIKLPDTEENEISLSSLHGKLVLVDFWASWCPPCRKENPALVKLFEKYKDQKFVNGIGFTIYSISLDRNKKAWLEAIKDDKLPWPIQVSDMKGARTAPALEYGVQAIPSSFLLDQNGVIIGINLRGEELEKAIADLVSE